MLRSEQGDVVQERRSYVNDLLAKDASLGSLWAATRPLGKRLIRSALAPAFYELAMFEDRLMVEWLIQQGGDDGETSSLGLSSDGNAATSPTPSTYLQL